MTTSRPEPSVMSGPIPYLVFSGRGNAALDFYARAFGATQIDRMPDPDRPGSLIHGQCVINGGALMLTDHMQEDPAPQAPMQAGHLQLVVSDGKTWFDRAVAAGCTVDSPYARQFWGDDWGLVRDPFGVCWGILQPGPQT